MITWNSKKVASKCTKHLYTFRYKYIAKHEIFMTPKSWPAANNPSDPNSSMHSGSSFPLAAP